MSFKSGSVVLGTSDTDVFLMPATFSGAVALNMSNVSGTARTYTLKHFIASLGTTVTITAGVTIAPNSSPSIPLRATLEAGDKIIGSASAGASVVAILAASIGPSTARVGLTPKGEYSAGTTYAVNDLVSRFGVGSFISMQNGNIGHTPESSPSFWMSSATKGATGDTGIAGTSGLTRVRVISTGSQQPSTDFGAGTTIDGVTLAVNDVILRASTTNPERNGVYVVPSTGAASRHTDFSVFDTMCGAYFAVIEGTANQDTLWFCSSNFGGVLDTNPLTVVRGPGGGLLQLNNLSDVLSKISARDNISTRGTAVASSSTINLETATGYVVDVSGNNDINAITLANGHERMIRFTGTLQWNHSASMELPNNGNPISVKAGDRAVVVGDASSVTRCLFYMRADGSPLRSSKPAFFLATGQSNMAQRPSFVWSPNKNCFNWNYSGVDGNVGTTFAPLSATTINIADKFISDFADFNPTSTVYVLNISIGSQPISQWKIGASAPDMYANITANITNALAAAGVSKIDGILWFQGENQVLNRYYEYPADFETVMTRFQGETWCPRETPIVVFGIAPTSVSGNVLTDMTNANLRTCVRADPGFRRFVDSAALGASFWADVFHLNVAGIVGNAGKAAREFVRGPSDSALLDQSTRTLLAPALARTGYRNLTFGGDFSANPWQRGGTIASAADDAVTADRFIWRQSGTGVVDILKTADAPTIAQAGAFTQHCLHVEVTTADASIASTDYYGFEYRIEGRSSAFLGFGQTGAKPITVSFWVKSTITGNYFISARNNGGNRSYCTQFVVNAANTWERKVLIIPGDVTGTWLYANGVVGIHLFFTVAAGDTYLFTPEVWGLGDVRVGNIARANGMSSTSNNFKLALVRAEEGFGASQYDSSDAIDILARCKRFTRKSFEASVAPAQNVASEAGAAFALSHVASTVFGTRIEFDDRMAIEPAVTTYNTRTANANWRDTANNTDRTATVANISEFRIYDHWGLRRGRRVKLHPLARRWRVELSAGR